MRLFPLILVSSAALGGCSIYTDDLKSGLGGGQGGTGGTDAGVPGYEKCGGIRTTVPERPDASSVMNKTTMNTCVAAVFNVDFGDQMPSVTANPTRYRDIGLDIDNKCTPEDEKSIAECRLLPLPDGTIPGATDGKGGIDNSFGSVIQAFRGLNMKLTSQNYSMEINAGAITTLFQVSGYNGEANDDQVTVDLFVSGAFGASTAVPDGGMADAATTVATPSWNGNDVWPVSADSLKDGVTLSQPKYSDAQAYVSSGKLVASFPTAAMRFRIEQTQYGLADLSLDMVAATLVCDIASTNEGCGFSLSACTFAGRLEADSLVKQLSQLPDPQGGPLCMDTTLYAQFKDSICLSIDVFYGKATSNIPCNALSFGATLDTSPAALGKVVTVPPPVPGTCPSGYDPATDSCAMAAPTPPM